MCEKYKSGIIAIDFDGTLALGNSFPNVNLAIPNLILINWLKNKKKDGYKLILWTCRENYGGKNYPDNPYLIDAINFCNKYGLLFDSVNANIGECWGECGHLYGRKILADLYIDDATFLCSSKIFWKFYLFFISFKLKRKLNNAK